MNGVELNIRRSLIWSVVATGRKQCFYEWRLTYVKPRVEIKINFNSTREAMITNN